MKFLTGTWFSCESEYYTLYIVMRLALGRKKSDDDVEENEGIVNTHKESALTKKRVNLKNNLFTEHGAWRGT